MSLSREGSPRLTTEIIVGLVLGIFAVVLFTDLPSETKLIAIAVFAILATLNFVALVGLPERWRRRWRGFVRERSIRRHPDLVNELYRLHDRIESALYRRAADKPSLALQIADLMASPLSTVSNPKAGEEFAERYGIVNRHFTWISQRVKDHRDRELPWTSPEFANALREMGDHLISVNAVLETVYRSFPKAESGYREVDAAAWDAFRDEYATLVREWQAFTERVDETIGYGTKRTIAPPRRLS
jgi:hypothetical protein